MGIGRMARQGFLAITAALCLAPTNSASQSNTRGKILDVVKNSACSKNKWSGRGVAPLSYIEGMAVTYAKVYVELKNGAADSSSVQASKDIVPNNRKDALSVYALSGSDAISRLRSTYTMAIGHGLLESSGNPTVGADCVMSEAIHYRHCSYYTDHPGEAEAGLFQPSFDSFDAARTTFAALRQTYKQPGTDCLQTLYQGQLPDKKRRAFGAGKTLEFQELTKSCPAFATEYESVMLRVDADHFGPIKRKEASYSTDCESMLRSVEGIL